jgi:hypothetical protein
MVLVRIVRVLYRTVLSSSQAPNLPPFESLNLFWLCFTLHLFVRKTCNLSSFNRSQGIDWLFRLDYYSFNNHSILSAGSPLKKEEKLP